MKKLSVFIVFLLLVGVNLAQAQTVRITGTVTSAQDGLSIPGVSVLVKGTTVGITTDLDGKYTINVPTSATTLIFSFVGMKTQEVEITGRTTIDVVLESESLQVEELVVVGYGVQRKREVTGAIATVKGESMASLATPSFESQLAGRSAGVQVTAATGVIGEAPRIRIRGVGSISQGTYPLVVVDGIPVFTGDLGGYASNNALGDINPQDIESVEILKDGSATAIYGSRAANGVMLITTKKGSKGKYNVTYSNYFGVASPVNLFDLLNAEQFVMISNEKRANRGQTDLAVGTDINTDWQEAVLRKRAIQQDHSLSISGSSDQSNYYFSLGYSDQDGVSRPNNMNRFTFRANLEQKLLKIFTVGANASITRSELFGQNTGANSLSGNIFSAIRQLPNTPVYDPIDATGYNIDDVNTNYAGRWDNVLSIDDNLPNIRYTLDKNVQSSKILRTIASTFAMVQILPELNFKTQISVDNAGTEGFLYWNAFHGDGQSVNGRVQNNFQNLTRWNLQNIISFNKKFAEVHNVNAVLVAEFQKQRVNSFFATGTDLSNDFFRHNVTSGSFGTQGAGGGLTENGFISYAGRLNYNYADKYFFQASVRRDGISSLPTANKYGIFPGFSVGWTITKESFMAGLPILSDLKLRASYAEVGNVDIGNYPYLGLYGSFKYADYNGIAFGQIGNDQLQWETSKKTDVGFDLALMENKYKLTFDYYINNQDGLIMAVPTPMSFGIPGNSINKNIGAVKNWGYEFSVDVNILSTKDYSLSVDGNLTLSQSEIKTLVSGQDIIGTYTILREKESRLAIFGYDYVGVNMANGNPIYKKADGTLVQGNIPTSTYFTYDPADPTNITTASSLVAADRKILGNALPTYFGSFGIKGRYKSFDLNVMFRYSGGNMVMNRTRMDLLNQKFQNNGAEILGRWQSATEPGDGWTPRLWYAGETFVNLTDNSSTRWVEKGNFVKLQTVALGYTLPKTLLSKVNIKNLRVFVQAQDFLMFTKYTGLDPEMEAGGVDYNGTPRQRVFTFGLTMNL
ncbi:MAG: SusC/RagA family TonB-linked outer membrane protein [Tenuifilaceae bacterium]